MSDRSHLSIGEVLSLLQDEFPDVTISKIRFLESQGLLDPERTPSGYRKFYEADIDRLRWILRQQRENFLPLKVIKDRLDEVPFEELLAAEEAEQGNGTSRGGDPQLFEAAGATGTPTRSWPTESPPPPPPPPPPDPAPPTSVVTSQATSQEDPAADPPPEAADLSGQPAVENLLDTGETTVRLTAEELARATGMTARQVGELERYGLIVSETVGNASYFPEDALIVARTASSFLDHGIEARHLRMYKVAAEREAGFLEQVIMPLLMQRNPKARHKALSMLDELVGLGDDLRQAMLRQALRDNLDRR